MKKTRRSRLSLGSETIAVLASWQLEAARGGLPQVTLGDAECPATHNAPSCNSCQETCRGSRCMTNCTSCPTHMPGD